MEVHIEEIVSNVSAVDDRALLSPEVLQQIVQAVLEAVGESRAKAERVMAERAPLGSAGSRARRA